MKDMMKKIGSEILAVVWFYLKALPGILLFFGTLGFSRAIRLAREERRQKALVVETYRKNHPHIA